MNPANAGQRIGSCGILLEMWRISTLLWPAVEWWERQAERRRFRYCVEHKLRSAESLPLQRVSLFARLRSIAALFLLMFVGRA